eukprot:Em0012g880a
MYAHLSNGDQLAMLDVFPLREIDLFKCADENEMANEQVEHMVSNEQVEDEMATEEVEDRMASERVEDTIATVDPSVESSAESLGSDIDAADDEDDSYAEAENDTDCNSDNNSDLNFTKCQCIDSFLPRSIMNNSSFCNGFAPASLIALSSSNAVSVFVCLLAASPERRIRTPPSVTSAGLHRCIRIVDEEVLYVVSSLLVAAVLACVPFATHSYGLQGSVCWIQSWKDNCPTNISVVGVVEQFQLTYGPSMAVLLIVSVAMVVMVIAIFCRSRKYHDGQNSKVLQQLLPLAVYPLLFLVFTIPPFVNCLYGTRTTAYALSIMSAVSVASWSFFTGISLIVHILEAKLRAYCKKRYTYKHLAYIGVDGEGTAIPTSDTSSTSRPTCTFVLPADNLATTSTYM